MKFNDNYLSEIHRRITALKLSQVRKISAVPKSLYSDLSEDSNYFWDLSVKKEIRNNPKKLISCLVILSKIQPEWYSYFISFCAEQCHRYNYEGLWRLLHKLTKLYYNDLILYRIVEETSPSDFFGNYLPEIKQFCCDCPVLFLKQQKPRAVRAQRKRGYNDHGSRKFQHENHSFVSYSGENPEKEDHRTQIKKRSALLNFLYG